MWISWNLWVKSNLINYKRFTNISETWLLSNKSKIKNSMSSVVIHSQYYLGFILTQFLENIKYKYEEWTKYMTTIWCHKDDKRYTKHFFLHKKHKLFNNITITTFLVYEEVCLTIHNYNANMQVHLMLTISQAKLACEPPIRLYLSQVVVQKLGSSHH